MKIKTQQAPWTTPRCQQSFWATLPTPMAWCPVQSAWLLGRLCGWWWSGSGTASPRPARNWLLMADT